MVTERHNVSLKAFNTFGIDVKAAMFHNIKTLLQLVDTIKNYTKSSFFILGGGSNILLTKDIDLPVLHINIKGISIVKEAQNHIYVKAMAGENWHEFVLWTIKHNYGGVENLSLIPGNIGTAPIQNIGAYGVELKDVFHSCEALNIETNELKVFKKEDCKFGYRDSVFKQDLKGKYIIISVCLKLTKQQHKLHVEYGAIKNELLANKILSPNLKDISNAVITIRQSKLPDPKVIGNSGSFFKNPVITKTHFYTLKINFPNIPSYVVSENQIKIPAGWLIEAAGFKGKRFENYGVHKNQALVLVNYGGAKGNQILELAKLIQLTVKRLFNISLETEVNIIA